MADNQRSIAPSLVFRPKPTTTPTIINVIRKPSSSSGGTISGGSTPLPTSNTGNVTPIATKPATINSGSTPSPSASSPSPTINKPTGGTYMQPQNFILRLIEGRVILMPLVKQPLQPLLMRRKKRK